MDMTPAQTRTFWLTVCSPLLLAVLGIPLLFIMPLVPIFLFPFLLPVLVILAFIAAIRAFKAGWLSSPRRVLVVVLLVVYVAILVWCGYMIISPGDVA